MFDDGKDPIKWKFNFREMLLETGVLKEEGDEFLACSNYGCPNAHHVTSDDFFVVYGNITRGISGGMVGNNIDNGVVKRVHIYCLNCFCGYLCKGDYND